jgi:hypothetical protein
VVSVTDNFLGMQAWYNEARASKPQTFAGDAPRDPTAAAGACDFCRWREMTARDAWGRPAPAAALRTGSSRSLPGRAAQARLADLHALAAGAAAPGQHAAQRRMCCSMPHFTERLGACPCLRPVRWQPSALAQDAPPTSTLCERGALAHGGKRSGPACTSVGALCKPWAGLALCRVENEHAVTASNLFKYCAPAHGLVLFRRHDPLAFTAPELRGALAAAAEWLRLVCL